MPGDDEQRDDGRRTDEATDASRATSRRAYEPPRILWREPYEPLSFGISCAKQPGNPGCNPGPFSS